MRCQRFLVGLTGMISATLSDVAGLVLISRLDMAVSKMSLRMPRIRADDLGCDLDTADELDSMAIKIADELPRLLKMAGLPDTSDNRRRMIDLVIARYSMPKNAPSKMFYKFATRWRPKRR